MIETPRLTLRPFAPEDEKIAISLLTCPEFMAYSPTGALDFQGAKLRFSALMSGYETNGLGKLAVVVKSSGALIGYCGIEMCEIEGASNAELGFRLQTDYRGVGYATEAARAVLEQTELASSRVIAFTEPANKPSMKVLEKLGFRRTGESSFGGMAVVLFNRST
jgi:ribosomal-protein-alanine N-acetyltransferase